MRVVQHHKKRRTAAGCSRMCLQELHEQLTRVVSADFAGQLCCQLVVGQVQRQDAAEERSQTRLRRPNLHAGQDA